MCGHFGRQNWSHNSLCFTTDQIVSENVDFVLRKFWEIDNCGMESLPVLSRNEKLVSENDKHSIKFVHDHYQIAIPWKEDHRLSIPDSYKMAYQRLQNLEKCLMKAPSVAADYNQVIEKHLKKGYVRKIESGIEQPGVNSKWYLPHFAVLKDI